MPLTRKHLEEMLRAETVYIEPDNETNCTRDEWRQLVEAAEALNILESRLDPHTQGLAKTYLTLFGYRDGYSVSPDLEIYTTLPRAVLTQKKRKTAVLIALERKGEAMIIDNKLANSTKSAEDGLHWLAQKEKHVPPTEAELGKWLTGLAAIEYEPGTLGHNIGRMIREIRRLREMCGKAAASLEFFASEAEMDDLPELSKKTMAAARKLRAAAEGRK